MARRWVVGGRPLSRSLVAGCGQQAGRTAAEATRVRARTCGPRPSAPISVVAPPGPSRPLVGRLVPPWTGAAGLRLGGWGVVSRTPSGVPPTRLPGPSLSAGLLPVPLLGRPGFSHGSFSVHAGVSGGELGASTP